MPNPDDGFFEQFASDNTAGICPEALTALCNANEGFAPSYGNDPQTQAVCDQLRSLFETDAEVFFVFNGTAANSLALATLCQPYQSVICTDTAHIETDECGAPEFFSNGSKLLLSPHRQGKLTVAGVHELVTRRTDIHYPRPRAISLTQATELGTVYGIDAITELARIAHAHQLTVHMDGARLANAAAFLRASLADLTWRAGVDVLCFGGTKMGLPFGEAILFFNHALGDEFAYRCKQSGQLASKMRFLSTPWQAMLADEVWLKHATHANAMARYLAEKIARCAGAEILLPTEANGVFVNLPPRAAQFVRDLGWKFYTFIGGGARFMCSWATQPAAVDCLSEDIDRALHACNGDN